jgi:hydrogenase maturation protease
MNRALVDRIANAVLYEGYILYPYRPSVKNRQRWTFGGLYPADYVRRQDNGDASSNQTECLVHGTPDTTIKSVVRFLHLTARLVGEVEKGVRNLFDGGEQATLKVPDTFFEAFRPVETLRVGEQLYHSWQEAEEREAVLGEVAVRELLACPRRVPFAFPGVRRMESLRAATGEIAGVMAREQQTVEGEIEVHATEVGEGLFRLTIRVENFTPMTDGERADREEAALRSLASTHTLLSVRRGEFVSLLDPPECWREAVAACRNVGTWPVLVGAEGQMDTMLSSPIILYDYPQVAEESPGDFFDGTEIDEMLTLRILTLTNEEKLAMAAVDGRARALLERTENMARHQFLGLHGTIRTPRTMPAEEANG